MFPPLPLSSVTAWWGAGCRQFSIMVGFWCIFFSLKYFSKALQSLRAVRHQLEHALAAVFCGEPVAIPVFERKPLVGRYTLVGTLILGDVCLGSSFPHPTSPVVGFVPPWGGFCPSPQRVPDPQPADLGCCTPALLVNTHPGASEEPDLILVCPHCDISSPRPSLDLPTAKTQLSQLFSPSSSSRRLLPPGEFCIVSRTSATEANNNKIC